jgi:histidinol phosphatase-like PHP family hydrolase
LKVFKLEMIDLHIHSEFSIDAADSPEIITERAAAVGLSAISLTDHENIDSLPRARAKAQELGLDYINGVEIGVANFVVGDAVIPTHILGYEFCKTHGLPAGAGSDSHGIGKVGHRLYDPSHLRSLRRFQAGAPPWK